MSHDDKMRELGQMVFGMMTDVLVLPDAGFGRRTVTLPDGKGGKHSLALIIAQPKVADAMEAGARVAFDVLDVPVAGAKGRKI